MTTTRLVIIGAAGRMGERLLTLGSADTEVSIVAAIDCAHHQLISKATCVSGVSFAPTLDATTQADVVIDFSTPEATDAVLTLCDERQIPLVLATTGLTAAHEMRLADLATRLPVLRSPSMSQAVIIAMRLVAQAAKSLATQQPDVEIIERHHRYKADAPSGTALKFGEIVAAPLNLAVPRHGREGKVGQRPRNEIGYHAVRTGDNPGEHSIIFGMLGETLEITVKASNRDCYALGAIAAAKFLVGKKPGLYSMFDVLPQ